MMYLWYLAQMGAAVIMAKACIEDFQKGWQWRAALWAVVAVDFIIDAHRSKNRP